MIGVPSARAAGRVKEMRALKLLVYGVLGLLGLLRGAELLIFGRAIVPALIPLALGIVFAALFVRTWKMLPS